MNLEPGQTISRYRLVEKVGEGGMGVVWKARDTELNRHVALKILPADLTADEERRLRFKREAQAAAALSHPNIAVVHEVGEHEGAPYIVMEYLEGRSLRKVIKGRSLSAKEWLRLAAPIAEGLVHAHRNGVVHRDLKPDNIVITEEGQVKILDFGLAKLTQPEVDPASSGEEEDTRLETISRELTRAGKVFGTVAYMSPEQARGEAVDHRSDLFSFGVILYEMASGRLPFKRKSEVETLSAVIAAEPEALSQAAGEMPAEAERVVRKALEKEPDRRYQSASDLAADLKNLERDLDSGRASIPAGVTRSGAALQAEVRKPASRLGRRLILTFAVLALLAAVMAVYKRLTEEVTPAPAGGAAIDSIAVLPFESGGNDPDTAYLSDGITESLINSLSRISSLRVVPRSVVFGYKGSQVNPKKVGEELGVGAVVTGRVVRRGDSLVVGAELVDVSTISQLWGERYDRTVDDLFEIQEEITREIAGNLRLQLTPEEESRITRRHTEDLGAYEAYQRGQGLLLFFSEKELEAALGHFEEALAIDPDYTLALAGLASVEAQIYRNVDASESRLDRAMEHARRALQLDPELARAHAAMGEIHSARYEYAQAAEKYREAIRLEPRNPFYHDLLSWALAYLTPPDSKGAEEAAREAIRLDSRFGMAYYHLGRALIHQERYDEAIDAFEHQLVLDRDPSTAELGLAQAYLARGEFDRALASLERRVSALGPLHRIVRAAIYIGQGKRDSGLQDLEVAVADGYRDSAFLEASRYFDTVRADPRFKSLLARAGEDR